HLLLAGRSLDDHFAGDETERPPPLARMLDEDDGLEAAAALGREGVDEHLHRRIEPPEHGEPHQNLVAPGEHAPTDDVASDRPHQEDDGDRGEEAEAGDGTPDQPVVHRAEDVVDPTPEYPEDPGGSDGRDRDEEPGNQSNPEPVLHPLSHDGVGVITTQRRERVKERRRALVTGGAIRLGRAIALALAERGMDVAIGYRHSRRDAQATVRQLAASGARAVALRGDLADARAAGRLVREAARALGGLDV